MASSLNKQKPSSQPQSSLNKTNSKVKNGKDEEIVQLTKSQLKNMIEGLVAEATKPLNTQIAALRNEIAEIQKSQKFISENHDGLNKDYKSVLLSNKKQKQELSNLAKRTDELQKRSSDEELKLDELEQYDRRQNLELEGVPFMENEDVNKITMELAKQLEVDLVEEDISIAHRLPRKRPHGRIGIKPKHPTIIVRFISRHKRNEIYANRFKAKNMDEFPVDNMEQFYINENLTQRRKRLFWLTKNKSKELDYKFIWTVNGQIFVRKTDNSEKIAVKEEYDLNFL